MCVFARSEYFKGLKSDENKTEKENSKLALSVAMQHLELFSNILKNKKLLNDMDLSELTYFFQSLDRILLTVDKPEVNEVVREILEEKFDWYINYYKQSPEKFLERVNKKSVVTHWENMDELFASLGILLLYIDGRESFYEVDEEAVKLTLSIFLGAIELNSEDLNFSTSAKYIFSISFRTNCFFNSS